MRKRPRLVDDIRRRSIRRRLFCIAVMAVVLFAAWETLRTFSEKFRSEGNALLAEIDAEKDVLSGRAVDRVVLVRKTIGVAVSKAKAALKAPRFAYAGNPRDIAATREEERETEARSYVTIYRTNVERADAIARELESAIAGGRKSELERRLDGISANETSKDAAGMSELDEASGMLSFVVGMKIVPPWFYHRERDEARAVLDVVRSRSRRAGWRRELAAIEGEARAFADSIDSGIAEMRGCDKRARDAIESLKSIPFGGKRLVKKCLDELEEARVSFDAAGAAAGKAVEGAVDSFNASAASLRAQSSASVKKAQNLFSSHGPEFVPGDSVKEVESLAGAFEGRLKDASAAVEESRRLFLSGLEKRNLRVSEIDAMRGKLVSVPLQNEKEVEDACYEAYALAREIGAATVEEIAGRAKNGISEAGASVSEAEAAVAAAVREIEARIPDWNQYSGKISSSLEMVRVDVGKSAGDAETLSAKLADMSGPGWKILQAGAAALSSRAKTLLESIPRSVACSNGIEAADAESLAGKYRDSAAELAKDAASFREEFEKALSDGRIARMKYVQSRQEWPYYMGLGKLSFSFSGKFDAPGPHKIEIFVSKLSGQLYLPSKMARGIELSGSISDSSGSRVSGSLVFGNIVQEDESTLLSFVSDGQSGWRDFNLDFKLKYRSRELTAETIKEWNPRHLQMRLVIDGKDQDAIWERGTE